MAVSIVTRVARMDSTIHPTRRRVDIRKRMRDTTDGIAGREYRVTVLDLELNDPSARGAA